MHVDVRALDDSAQTTAFALAWWEGLGRQTETMRLDASLTIDTEQTPWTAGLETDALSAVLGRGLLSVLFSSDALFPGTIKKELCRDRRGIKL